PGLRRTAWCRRAARRRARRLRRGREVRLLPLDLRAHVLHALLRLPKQLLNGQQLLAERVHRDRQVALEARHVRRKARDERDQRGGGHHERPRRAMHQWGILSFSPPAMISNSARRFFAHAASSSPCTAGRSLPKLTVSNRDASTPCETR